MSSADDFATAAASNTRYKLDKQLLDRYPRRGAFVKAFFYDVGVTRKKATVTDEAPT